MTAPMLLILLVVAGVWCYAMWAIADAARYRDQLRKPRKKP